MPEPLTPQSMGRRGGLAKAARMTPEQRSEIARKIAKIRWEKQKASQPDARVSKG